MTGAGSTPTSLPTPRSPLTSARGRKGQAVSLRQVTRRVPTRQGWGPGPLRGSLVHRLAPPRDPRQTGPGLLHHDPPGPQSSRAAMTLCQSCTNCRSCCPSSSAPARYAASPSPSTGSPPPSTEPNKVLLARPLTAVGGERWQLYPLPAAVGRLILACTARLFPLPRRTWMTRASC